MVDTNKLRGLIAERGLTGGQVAKKIGISDKTFYSKMKTGAFGVDEANKMIMVLNIENPCEIFFAKE